MTANFSPLIRQYLEELRGAAKAGSILDLACGAGRNGLYLIDNDIPVVFADVSPAALRQVQEALSSAPRQGKKPLATLWQADFEPPVSDALGDGRFGGIMIFRYLHRPLMEGIKRAVKPGGIVVYETFTIDQARIGRPTNPDFLLRHRELPDYFSDWKILHSFEGMLEQNKQNEPQAISQLVAVKPG